MKPFSVVCCMRGVQVLVYRRSSRTFSFKRISVEIESVDRIGESQGQTLGPTPKNGPISVPARFPRFRASMLQQGRNRNSRTSLPFLIIFAVPARPLEFHCPAQAFFGVMENPLCNSCCFSLIGSTRDSAPVRDLVSRQGNPWLCGSLVSSTKFRQDLVDYSMARHAQDLGCGSSSPFTSPRREVLFVVHRAVCPAAAGSDPTRQLVPNLHPTPAPCAIALVEWPGLGSMDGVWVLGQSALRKPPSPGAAPIPSRCTTSLVEGRPRALALGGTAGMYLSVPCLRKGGFC
jgi:hypothetical protein